MNSNDCKTSFAENVCDGSPVQFALDKPGLPVGTVVGAHRWPYESAHPDCWGAPWKGVVLALNDPLAWSGNAALSTQEKIDSHIAWCTERGLLKNDVPVQWDFGDEQVVYFQKSGGDDRCHELRPYAEDYLDWQATRAAKYKRLERVARS